MMADEKPRMLIVEDSSMIKLLEDLFRDRFDVTAARNGAEACGEMKDGNRFDVAIVDCIMPVESSDRSLADTQATGLRVIRRLLENGLCSRFLVLTVRWDIEDDLARLFAGREKAKYRLLLKSDTKDDEIVETVHALIA